MSANDLALFAAGVLWPFLLQALKTAGLPISGRLAQWVAIGVAFLLAILATLLTGGDLSPDGIARSGAIVVSLALIVYRQLIVPTAPASLRTPGE